MSQKHRQAARYRDEVTQRVKKEASSFMLDLMQNKPDYIPQRLWHYLLRQSLEKIFPSV